LSEDEAKDRSSMMPSAHSVRKSAHIRGLRAPTGPIYDGSKGEEGFHVTVNESITFVHLMRPYVALDARELTFVHLNRLPYDPKVATKLTFVHGAVV